jgi:hypothetical protein
VAHAVISELVSSAMRVFVAIVKMLKIAQSALASTVHTVATMAIATANVSNAIKFLAISAQTRVVCFVKAVISTSVQIARSMIFPPTLFGSIIVLAVLIIGFVMIAKYCA